MLSTWILLKQIKPTIWSIASIVHEWWTMLTASKGRPKKGVCTIMLLMAWNIWKEKPKNVPTQRTFCDSPSGESWGGQNLDSTRSKTTFRAYPLALLFFSLNYSHNTFYSYIQWNWHTLIAVWHPGLIRIWPMWPLRAVCAYLVPPYYFSNVVTNL